MSLKCVYAFLVITLECYYTQAVLIYPPTSVFQITAAIAAPIVLPGRKLYWDWGLQMNYNLPFNVMHLYNAPIFDDRKRREVETQYEGNVTTYWNAGELKYEGTNVKSRKHSSDFTAGELYQGLENLLVSYGFHETCLLRSVCEMARHPFADEQENLLTQILTFILTPSIHEAFSPLEILYREVYEEAELRGFLHYNCAELYHDCKQDLLTSITNIVTIPKHEYNYDN